MKTIFRLQGQRFFSVLLVALASATVGTRPAFSLDLAVLPDSAVSKTGGDDIAQLKQLASGIGWEFEPNKMTDGSLRELGMRWIRCINVDPLGGRFDEKGAFIIAKENPRLNAHLQTCREIGANPHIIIAQGVPAPLGLDPKEVQERMAIMGQTPGTHSFWNGDWDKLRSYWKSYFHLVLLDSGFPNARFEVGNEPDIDGQFPRLVGKQGAMGSRALYNAYLDIYRHVSQAAKEFEAENPGTKVTLGGPALCWSYSFKFGELNWATEFLRDVAKEKLKLDFLGVHFYGNISSLNGGYEANYPTFSEMLATTKKARDEFLPGLPIYVTEWGASYNTNNSEASLVNASNIGAAWSAAFLNTLLESDVPVALYLVTTDMRANDAANKMENVWGWPALYVNPVQFGQPWPKAPAHVFRMIRDLAPQRVALDGVAPESGVNGIASVDKASGEITVMLWNYRFQIPELNGKPIDLGADADVTLHIKTPRSKHGKNKSAKTPNGKNPKFLMDRWLVSADTSNALAEFQATGKITSRCDLQRVESREVRASEPACSFRLPSGSVTFLRFHKALPD